MKRHGLPNWAGHIYKADRHYLGYSALIGVLVGAAQEKDTQLSALQEKVRQSNATTAKLRGRVSVLEELVSRLFEGRG